MTRTPELACADDSEAQFHEHISQAGFPCVGAKSALARGRLTVLRARDMASAWNDVEIHGKLLDWVHSGQADDDGLASFAVLFDGPRDLSEKEFEHLLWQRLQSLADKDEWRGQVYDQAVSADPDNPHFALSFGGAAFFVVGLHPHASRPARRFVQPAMVFNPHAQFERLREQGRYERMRERILQRDLELAGSINPMLAEHGESSAARQYSGRAVSDDWACPFRDPRA